MAQLRIVGQAIRRPGLLEVEQEAWRLVDQGADLVGRQRAAHDVQLVDGALEVPAAVAYVGADVDVGLHQGSDGRWGQVGVLGTVDVDAGAAIYLRGRRPRDATCRR